ncbi:MAG: protein kinase [Candidatus Rhabdochlamydia sp.]
MDSQGFDHPITLAPSQPPSKPVSHPFSIGPYQIECLLSQGGMSLLYLALHPETKEVIVVKVLRPEFIKSSEMIERFLHEAKLMSLTSHPHLVKLYGEGMWEGGAYIAMEFIQGICLRQFIEQQTLSMKKSLNIWLQIANTLAHLHAHHIIHKDLKPENILITERGEIKMIDLGIATFQEEIQTKSKATPQILGTPAYMSPELKENPSSVSFASDIYALGVIGYELVLGKLSFGLIHLCQIPSYLRQILEKAIAVSVARRYQDIHDLITDLSSYLLSGKLEKEKPATDQAREMAESLQQANVFLSPQSLISTAHYHAAIAKLHIPGQITPYVDQIELPHGLYGFIIAEPINLRIEGVIYLSTLRGMIRSLLLSSKPFELSSFLFQLQTQVQSDFLHEHYAFSFLLLDRCHHELTLVCCGHLATLLHLSPGKQFVSHFSDTHPPLGSFSPTELHTTRYEWAVGDQIIFHTFPASLETMFKEVYTQSPQSQVNHFMKKIPLSLVKKRSHIAITLHRVG